jgi:hypothetical protein
MNSRWKRFLALRPEMPSVLHISNTLTKRRTVQVLGRVTVEASTVELVNKYRRPKGTEQLRQKKPA